MEQAFKEELDPTIVDVDQRYKTCKRSQRAQTAGHAL
jgi:hypothetical protein